MTSTAADKDGDGRTRVYPPDRSNGQGSEPRAAPRHVGLIMDGNGRWAKAKGLPRVAGHRQGVEALRRSVSAAMRLGLRYLTVYGFSTENWRRPTEEVQHLMALLQRFLHSEIGALRRQGVRFRALGDRERLPPGIGELLAEAEAATAAQERLDLIVALSYGGRQELLSAARRLIAAVLEGGLAPDEIDETRFRGALQLPDVPDPEIIIRTSGEQRLSNFLLWQAAHSELIFVDCLWPDFGEPQLAAALELYRQGPGAEIGGSAPRGCGLDRLLKERAG